ncbi:PREDICTED: uncharacterized protein LOC108777839 [Cyphomyrmex costatus]|uniref:uncharacterized protein LOC108777839 n=1 Tax=Cyphomyrmex costatus TaxID=456900 RepID=UPI00085225B8|nr:PREDICTED: uncharacterized protein LOC108777839 [Cyphomyrmex costatus]
MTTAGNTSMTSTISQATLTLRTSSVTVGGRLPQIDKLDGVATYNNWKFAMKMYLIHGTVLLDPIIKPASYAHVCTAATAKEAWRNLQTVYEDKGLNRRLGLLTSMFNLRLEDYTCTEQYIIEAMSLAQKLADIEKPVDDEFLAIVLLHGLPSTPRFETMKSGLQATHDVLNSEIVKARLLQDVAGREDSSQNDRKLVCYNCKKEGHIRPKCPKLKQKVKERKHSKDARKTDEVKEDSSKLEEKGKNTLLISGMTALLAKDFKSDDWFIDIGATTHMTHRNDWLEDSEFIKMTEIAIADSSTCKSNKVGQVKVNLTHGKSCFVSNPMYVPQLSTNLLSVNKITEKGLTVVFDSESCKVYDTTKCTLNGKPEISAAKIGGLYRLDQERSAVQVATLSTEKLAKKEAIMTASSEDLELWHRRLGLHYKYMVALKDGLAPGISFTNSQKGDWNCVACLEGKTIVEKTRCLLQDSKLDKRFWDEAVLTAIYLRNRCPTRALRGVTSQEAWSGKRVDISHLKVFGCKVYVHIPKELRTKLDSKSKEHIMLESEDREVQENTEKVKTQEVEDAEEEEEFHEAEEIFKPERRYPLRIRQSPKRYADEEEFYSCVASENNMQDPMTRSETSNSNNSSRWKSVMEEEIKLLQGHLDITKRYTQVHGVDYEETFAPVVRHSIIRMLIGLAAVKKLDIHHWDITTAFLNGRFHEEIYMQQPEGYVEKGKEQKVYRLKKAIYGLKQTSRTWNEEIDKNMKELGF